MSIKHCTCGSLTQVVDSRPNSDGSIRRRRECPRCDIRTTTYEISSVERRRLKDLQDRYEVIASVINTKFKVR